MVLWLKLGGPELPIREVSWDPLCSAGWESPSAALREDSPGHLRVGPTGAR